MLSRVEEFMDNIDSLTEKKIENMSIRAKNTIRIQQLEITMRQVIAKNTGRIMNGNGNKILKGGVVVFSVKRTFFNRSQVHNF